MQAGLGLRPLQLRRNGQSTVYSLAYAFVLQLLDARVLRSHFHVCYAHLAYALLILRAPAA